MSTVYVIWAKSSCGSWSQVSTAASLEEAKKRAIHEYPFRETDITEAGGRRVWRSQS